MYSDIDMEDGDTGYSPPSTSNYKLRLDEDRFEEQYLSGQRGYYDKIEKVFVSVNAFDVLFTAVCFEVIIDFCCFVSPYLSQFHTAFSTSKSIII
jgi:hypothetical protein